MCLKNIDQNLNKENASYQTLNKLFIGFSNVSTTTFFRPKNDVVVERIIHNRIALKFREKNDLRKSIDHLQAVICSNLVIMDLHPLADRVDRVHFDNGLISLSIILGSVGIPLRYRTLLLFNNFIKVTERFRCSVVIFFSTSRYLGLLNQNYGKISKLKNTQNLTATEVQSKVWVPSSSFIEWMRGKG